MSSAKVYEAISKVTSELASEGISKGRKNQQQGYAFRGIDDVYSALSRKLADNKLCILPRVIDSKTIERKTRNGGTLFYTILDVEFDFVSAVDGSKHTIRVVGEAMDSADKSTNKAMSAAYKYACFISFCIPVEGDNDADATTHEVAPMEQGPYQSSQKEIDQLYTFLLAEARAGRFLSAWQSNAGPVREAIRSTPGALTKLQNEQEKAELAASAAQHSSAQPAQAGPPAPQPEQLYTPDDDDGAASHNHQQEAQQQPPQEYPEPQDLNSQQSE